MPARLLHSPPSALLLISLELTLVSFCLSDPCSEKPPAGPLQVSSSSKITQIFTLTNSSMFIVHGYVGLMPYIIYWD